MRIRKGLLLASLIAGFAATAVSIAGPEFLRICQLSIVDKQPVYPWAWPRPLPGRWPAPTENARETGISYEKVTAANREDPTKILFAWRLRMGWPFSALEGGGTAVIPLPPTVAGTSTTQTVWTARWGRATALIPYGVRPLALAADVVTYAAAAYGLGLAIALRRRSRLRGQGRCTVCEYALSGAETCPECGHAEA
ncbi:MAG: hypothetical protein K2Q09_01555 [Phycisphaerales bacterium]|nr:hypothetical protein [Phycisphaerales bacterium]